VSFLVSERRRTRHSTASSRCVEIIDICVDRG
jgi:hypothetical protein